MLIQSSDTQGMPNKGVTMIENVQRKAVAWILGSNSLTDKEKLNTLDILPLTTKDST